MHLGQSSYKLEKALNTLHTDFDRKDDYPLLRGSWRNLSNLGPYAGRKAEKEECDKMLNRLYELNGWDKATSWQTGKCMTELGLEDVTGKLEKAGQLID